MEAGISLAENPTLSFDYVPDGSADMTVEIGDTDDTTFRRSFPILPGS